MDYIDLLATIFEVSHRNGSFSDDIQSILRSIRECLDLCDATLIVVPRSQHELTIFNDGGDKALIDEYRSEYFFLDNHHGFYANTPLVIQPGDDAQCNSKFREFCQNKIKIRYVLSADFELHHSQFRLRLGRTLAQGNFSDIELSLVSRLSFFIQSFLEKSLVIDIDYYRNLMAEKILENNHIGFVIINRHHDVIYKSSGVDELLSKSGAFICNKEKLVARSKECQTLLENLLAQLTAANPVAVSVLPSRSRESHTFAVSRQFDWNSHWDLQCELFTCFISSSESADINLDLLAPLWKISPAEKRLLCAIMKFNNVKKASTELGISPNTARVQLKSAYRKLGIDNKARLIKWLGSANYMATLATTLPPCQQQDTRAIEPEGCPVL